MPWFRFVTQSGGVHDPVEDDAADPAELAQRLDDALAAGQRRILTFVTVEEEPAKTEPHTVYDEALKRERTTLREIAPAKTRREVTGSWATEDVQHIIAAGDELEEVGDLELEEEPGKSKKPNPQLFGG